MYSDRPQTPPPSSSLAHSPVSQAGPSRRVSTFPPPNASQSRPSKRRRTTAAGQPTTSLTAAQRLPLSPISSPSQTAPPLTASQRSQGPVRLVVKGNVTPSRAAPFFQLRSSQTSSLDQRQPPPSSSPSLTSPPQPSSSQSSLRFDAQPEPKPSPRSILQLTSPTPRRLNAAFKSNTRLGDHSTALLQSLLRCPPPAASAPYAAGNPALSLLALRSMTNPAQHGMSLFSAQATACRGLYSRPFHGINTRSYLSTFSHREDLDWYELESSLYDDDSPSVVDRASQSHLAHPLCCAYSYSSRAAEPSAQWLAIGDNEGRIVLINTLDDTTSDEFSGGPQWRTSGSSIDPSAPVSSVFELSWRHDDVLLASSAPSYMVAVWDVSTQSRTELFSGPKGTSRSIHWDPCGGGNLLCSGGRDGAIHLFDRRVRPHETSRSVSDDESTHSGPSPVEPVLSIWGAHTSQLYKPKKASGSSRARSVAPSSRSKDPWHPLQRGVTALAYLLGRPHCIVSGGCEDGRVRVWDWRSVESSTGSNTSHQPAASTSVFGNDPSDSAGALQDTNPASEENAERTSRQKASKQSAKTTTDVRRLRNGSKSRPAASRFDLPTPLEESSDISRLSSKNQSSHGISSLVVGNNTIFAACTDANIYALNAANLVAGLPATSSVARQAALPNQALYNSMQRGNTLYAKLALNPQEQILAVGCNSGKIVLYDVKCKGGADAQSMNLDASTGVVLQGGHSANSEINGLAWANGPQGTTLASIADDFTVRTWRPDRAFSQRHDGNGVVPLELDSDEEFDWETRERKVWRGGELDELEAGAGGRAGFEMECDSEEEDDDDDDGFDLPLRGLSSTSGCRLAFDSDSD
ncbi:hypothetical protein V8E36_002776 [Tilletia maclaganii]